jgi:hypothetical protein
MAWRSSGTNNDEMVDNLKRKSKMCEVTFAIADGMMTWVSFTP